VAATSSTPLLYHELLPAYNTTTPILPSTLAAPQRRDASRPCTCCSEATARCTRTSRRRSHIPVMILVSLLHTSFFPAIPPCCHPTFPLHYQQDHAPSSRPAIAAYSCMLPAPSSTPPQHLCWGSCPCLELVPAITYATGRPELHQNLSIHRRRGPTTVSALIPCRL
jgi:hypothetical protein